GLTQEHIGRWEAAGHDYSSWPGLDSLAAELAAQLPDLGIGPGSQDAGGYDDTDYAGRLWNLLRDREDALPPKYDPDILQRATVLVESAPEGWDEGPLAFSTAHFERYLIRKHIPWPRLASGALALDDQTFREMAWAYPVEIGPIREVRHALSQL